MGADSDKPSENNSEQAWWQPALILFAKFSGWIVVPVIAGALIGKWLDDRYGTDPFIFLTTVGFAFLISMFGLIKNVRDEYSKIENEKGENNQDKITGNNQDTITKQ